MLVPQATQGAVGPDSKPGPMTPSAFFGRQLWTLQLRKTLAPGRRPQADDAVSYFGSPSCAGLIGAALAGAGDPPGGWAGGFGFARAAGVCGGGERGLSGLFLSPPRGLQVNLLVA